MNALVVKRRMLSLTQHKDLLQSFIEQGWSPQDPDPFRAASPNHRSRYQGGAHCDEEAWEGSSEGYSSLEGILNS